MNDRAYNISSRNVILQLETTEVMHYCIYVSTIRYGKIVFNSVQSYIRYCLLTALPQ